MKIALIHCPFEHRTFSENLKVVDEEFCLAPPIVLAYVAAILEKAGHKVIIVDANALKLTKEKTLKILQKFSPEIIGFRADTYWFYRVIEWAKFFKEAMNVKIIVGGINITLYPKESLSHSEIDYGILGEAIEPLPELILALENNGRIDNIKGLVYRNNGKVVLNPPSDRLIDFDAYSFPARHLLPNHRYYSFISQRKNYTVMLTTTGCPFKCNFCAISNIPYRERSPQNVVDEIEKCYRSFNIREIDFFDACFFINENRVMAICDEIVKRKIKIEWSCRSRVDIVDEDILKKASQAGCRQIYYGIESASPQILKNINKMTDIKQIEKAIDSSRKYGIRTMGFFMVGMPGDTKETILSTMYFAKRLNLDFVQVCRTVAKPNTGLDNLLIKETAFDYWRNYIAGIEKEERLPSPWTNLSQKEIEIYMRRFYFNFYFRPSYILKRIIKAKSIGELMRYIRVAIKCFFCDRSDIKRD